MNRVDQNPGKEKPEKMGFDFYYLANFHCWCCGANVVVNVRYHHNMLCPDCDPAYHQDTYVD